MRIGSRVSSSALRHVAGTCAAAVGLVLVAAAPHAQQATFRSTVDLIAVDTQVIDRDGQPINKLTSRDFEVWVNGHPRRVVSADLVAYPLSTPMSFAPTNAERPAWITGDLPEVRGRIFIIAVDEMSFTTQALQRAVKTARAFVSSLQPEDVVGVYGYPLGTASLDLTHFRGTINQRLDRLTALFEPFQTSFQLSPSEMIDITARDPITMNKVIARECPLDPKIAGKLASTIASGGEIDDFTVIDPTLLLDPSCPARLQSDANAQGLFEEGQTTQSFFGLRDLLGGLSALPGPKTVLLLSAGMLSSDRVGGRPDVTTLLKTAGRDAAAADAMLYVMHFDDYFLSTYSAINPASHNAADMFKTQVRDSNAFALGLQRVAGESGGEYIDITAGNGELAFNRVLRETAAYYLLGVQPEDADRDGRTHFIRVKANAKGATVHSRQEVTIPRAR